MQLSVSRGLLLARLTLCVLALGLCPGALRAQSIDQALSVEQVRAIAKEATIYGFPMVDNYRIQHAYFVDRKGPEFKAPWNEISNTARVFTPADKAVQTPNSDTPYSMLGADLRTEPLVLQVPAIEKNRYYSLQFIDLYTHNFAYVGSRTTGNDAGNYLLAGPRWKGETPANIRQVIRCETEFAFVVYRTQLINPADLDNVRRVQAGYRVVPLSKFLGQAAPPAAPAISFLPPLTPETQKTSLGFFTLLNFMLQACPTHPSETALRQRFAQVGIAAGQPFDPAQLSAKHRQAFEQGMADAWQEFAQFRARMDRGELVSGDILGTREYLKNNYLYRMGAAVVGIYGNSREEAMYPAYFVDAQGAKLDGGQNRYTLRFAPNQLPPVDAFWSLTAYEMPSSLLFANPLNRYLINSPMLPQLKRDADGGVTLHVQADSPGPDRESNWLPVPKGPFALFLRLYRPQPAAIRGEWKPPALQPTAVPGGAKK